MATGKKSVTVKFKKVKETKGTWAYEAEAPEGAAVRSFYLTKPAVAELDNPESVTLTITAS
jgi:hypothetical protein